MIKNYVELYGTVIDVWNSHMAMYSSLMSIIANGYEMPVMGMKAETNL